MSADAGEKKTRPSRRSPRWVAIEEALVAEITSGKYASGDKLPVETEIAERFNVNRLTARQALASLQAKGFIRIERGRGTFVEGGLVTYGLGDRVRFSQNLAATRIAASRRLIEVREMPADPTVASRLDLEGGDPVLLLSVVGEADGLPVLFGLNHYPAVRFQGLDTAFRETGSLTAALGACGVSDYTRRSTELIARMPTVIEAKHLDQSRLEPVVETRSVDVDPDGRPIAYGVTVFAAPRVRFVVGIEP